MGKTLGQNQFEYNSLLKNFKQIKSHKIFQARRDSDDSENTIMNRLMNLTLKESGLQAESISKGEVNTKKIIDEIIFELSQTKNIGIKNFHVFNLPSIKGDTKQMKHLFKQLILNAVLYRSSLVPEIIISSEEVNGNLVFSIQDNGIGIDKIYLQDIFKPFNRGVIKNECQGVGLGLAISKQIANFHNGEIWGQSLGRGYGSTFYLSLPLLNKSTLAFKYATAMT